MHLNCTDSQETKPSTSTDSKLCCSSDEPWSARQLSSFPLESKSQKSWKLCCLLSKDRVNVKALRFCWFSHIEWTLNIILNLFYVSSYPDQESMYCNYGVKQDICLLSCHLGRSYETNPSLFLIPSVILIDTMTILCYFAIQCVREIFVQELFKIAFLGCNHFISSQIKILTYKKTCSSKHVRFHEFTYHSFLSKESLTFSRQCLW